MQDQGHEIQADTRWLSGSRPASEEAVACAVSQALDAAVALARAGDFERARELCAAVVFDAQPTIARREELLRATLHALLVAKGFKLLSRVAMAMGGRNIQVVVLPEGTKHVAPPRTWQEPRRTIYALDPRWLARLSPDDVFLRHWCEMLTAPRCSELDRSDTIQAPLSLEPV